MGSVSDSINKFLSHAADLEQDRQAFMERYRSRVFSVKDALIPAKRFHDWLRSGLLPLDIPQGKKNRMNVPEFIWVRLIDKLRQVGTPLEHIQQLKEHLFTRMELRELAARLGEQRVLKPKLGQVIDRLGADEELRQAALDELDSDTPFAALQDMDLTLLDTILLRLLNSTEEAGVMLTPNGYFRVWMESLGEPRMNLTHVYLSFTEEVRIFRSSRLWEQRTERLEELTPQEWQVIHAIRDRSAKEVTVTFPDKGQERKMDISTTKEEQLAEMLIELVKMGKYTDLRIKTQGSDSLFVERKKRRQL